MLDASPLEGPLDASLLDASLRDASLLEGPRASLLDASLLEARLAGQGALDLPARYEPGRRGRARGGQGGLSISIYLGKDGDAERGEGKRRGGQARGLEARLARLRRIIATSGRSAQQQLV